MVNNNSFFRVPKTVIYGRNSFEKAGVEAGLRGKKALIICDRIMDALGNTDRCRWFLNQQAVESIVYAGVNTEPTDEYVSESLQRHLNENCDLVISLGGGSCIDTGKAVSVLATNGGYIGEYVGGKKSATIQPVPHIAIPTTAGTGSEATDVTVIIDSSNDEKMMIKQPAFMPEVAIVDSELTVSSPKPVTAATGIDALTHAIEAYLSRKAHPLTDTLALSAMKLIVNNLREAYNYGENRDSRFAMALGSLQAGMAFTNASVGLVHGMSRPIGALFHVPHGISNAMLLPAVLEFSKEKCVERLADLGRIFSNQLADGSHSEAATFAISQVKQLCNDLNVPNLKNYGIDQQNFNKLLDKMSSDALKSGSPANNPRIPTQEEIKELYHTCYDFSFL